MLITYIISYLYLYYKLSLLIFIANRLCYILVMLNQIGFDYLLFKSQNINLMEEIINGQK